MTTYKVISPLVVAKQADGRYVHIYEGGFLPDDQDPDQLEQLLAGKMVAESDDTEDGAKPAPSASKAKWKAYALANGHTEEELADLSRYDIRALFDE